MTAHPEPAADVVRVTTLELFFDLVFVFTITQLTSVLFEEPNGRGLLQVVLMLGVIWWMYGGYAWLTNAVTAHTATRRLLLLGGMGGYFVISLAVPDAFSSSGLGRVRVVDAEAAATERILDLRFALRRAARP